MITSQALASVLLVTMVMAAGKVEPYRCKLWSVVSLLVSCPQEVKCSQDLHNNYSNIIWPH